MPHASAYLFQKFLTKSHFRKRIEAEQARVHQPVIAASESPATMAITQQPTAEVQDKATGQIETVEELNAEVQTSKQVAVLPEQK